MVNMISRIIGDVDFQRRLMDSKKRELSLNLGTGLENSRYRARGGFFDVSEIIRN